jgi:arylsulfatase A-like enzyme
MNERRAIVIVIDGLRASALGAYGNTWHGTPALDALASESIVIETMWAESPELSDFYQVAWADGELPRRLADAGGSFTLVTDDAALATWADATPGVEAWQVERLPSLEPVEDANETAVARMFAAVAERLQAWDLSPAAGPRVLWVHSRGYHGSWDAPLALRASLLDEGDPEAPTFVESPLRVSSDDHDALLGYRIAYAAQTMVLDECLGGLLSAVEAGEGTEPLLILAGARGFALGEHGVVGGQCSQLYGELLHLPCLIRTSGSTSAPPPRRRGLATPADLGATLLAWCGGTCDQLPAAGMDLRDDSSPSRTYVVSGAASDERSLRTEDWFLRTSASRTEADARSVELYAKPDDRWEANDVADRCPHDVEGLLALLGRAEHDPDASAFPQASTAITPTASGENDGR